MEDIKTRLSIVDAILDSERVLETDVLDGELVCFQLRRVLEQIAFSSLCAHQGVYESVRQDIDRAWRAKRIVETLNAVHPQFYPRPARIRRDEGDPVLHVVALEEGFLTRPDFEFLYDRCSDLIHTWNPFSDRTRVVDFERPIKEWVIRIKNLLSFHYVHLYGSRDVWVVQMVGEDEKTHALYGATVGLLTDEVRAEHGLASTDSTGASS